MPNTNINMPNVGDAKQATRARRRIRLIRVDSLRGPGEGAPPASTINVFPFPFGNTMRARHGHHKVFPAGKVRRVGAWRTTHQLGSGYGRGRN